MRIAVTGATGLIGRALVAALTVRGHEAVPLSRPAFDANDPTPQPDAFAACDAIVHLAGETVAGRWDASKKRAIYESRIQGTRKVVRSIEALGKRPTVLVCASAVGYYGNRGDTTLDEHSSAGGDFLAGVCADWESEALVATQLGVRVAMLRTGIVLSKRGGALEKMRTPFQLGIGGPFGSGKQFVPWIHLDDVVSLYIFAIENPDAIGAINAVSPDYATSSRFAQALGASVCRPAIVPAPGLALRLALGEFAESILASQLVMPTRAQDLGFKWQHGNLEEALDDVSPVRHPWNPNASFSAEQFIARPIDDVFAFFSDARNLQAITPERLGFEIVRLPERLERGAQISYKLRLRGLPITWQSLITRWNPPFGFTDVQMHGPYAFWEHRHDFKSIDGGTLVRDAVAYALPLYPFSNVARGAVARDVQHIFSYRREALYRLL